MNLENNQNTKNKRLKLIFKLIPATIVILILFLSPLALKNLYDIKSTKINEAIIDKVQFTVPGANIIGSSIGIGLTDININCEFQTNIFRKESNNGRIIFNELHLIGRPLIQYSYEKKRLMNNLSDSTEVQEQANAKNIKNSLDKLKVIPQGTKIQGAVYFKNPIDIDSVEELIKNYDIDPNFAWYAIYAGNSFSSKNVWGFSKLIITSVHDKTEVDLNKLANSEVDFKTEMKNFEINSKYLDDLSLTNEINAINDFLFKNKTTIKGMIVVAKTTNIINLLSNSNVSRFEINDIDFDY